MQQDAIYHTQFKFKGQTNFYKGKVRDVYTVDDKLVMVTSDRISAFDHILPRAIPYKGQVLNQTAIHFLSATKDIVPNWLISSPDPNVSIGYNCTPFRVEMVVRGYLAGHAARVYKAGGRLLCGVSLPEGLRENDPLPNPIITPTTKAIEGHDEDISKEDILQQGILSLEDYEQLEKYTLDLYARGVEMAKKQGLILVDTKYEFGKIDNTIYLIDEIHTPDSSRYFYLDDYDIRQTKGLPQKQLSKEFVRQWLIEKGFEGKQGQKTPYMPDEFIEKISLRYIKLYEKITGKHFEKHPLDDINKRIYQHIESYFGQ